MKPSLDLPFAPPLAPLVLGVDPGIKGAMAILYPDGKVTAIDMPVVDGVVDVERCCSVLRSVAPTFVVMEQVWAMPSRPDAAGKRRGMGAATSFTFGRSYGRMEGAIIACGFKIHLVTPQKWKKFFGLDADKERARMLALRMWPSGQFGRKADQGRAEAALIARYGAQNFGTTGALGAAA